MRSFSECWQPGNAWQPYRTAASRQPSHIAAVTLGEDHRRSQGPDILAIKIMFDCRWSMLIHAVHCTFSNQRMTDMRVAFCRDLSPSMGIFYHYIHYQTWHPSKSSKAGSTRTFASNEMGGAQLYRTHCMARSGAQMSYDELAEVSMASRIAPQISQIGPDGLGLSCGASLLARRNGNESMVQ